MWLGMSSRLWWDLIRCEGEQELLPFMMTDLEFRLAYLYHVYQSYKSLKKRESSSYRRTSWNHLKE